MYAILVACVLLVVEATVHPEDAKAQIFRYENTNDGKGNYRYSVSSSNGITQEETGRLVNVGESNAHIVVEGSYSYAHPDGTFVKVRYTADENGYRILDALPTQGLPLPQEDLPPSVVATFLGK